MDMFTEALKYAAEKHGGMTRKNDSNPYLLHPLEAAVIAGTLTGDPEVLSAALLHDTVEDSGADLSELASLFGPRVAALVASETEDKMHGMDPAGTWQSRKEKSLKKLAEADDPGVGILWLSDKLSNMRSFYRMRKKHGNSMWEIFHQKDPSKQEWYYRSVCGLLEGSLGGTEAFAELKKLVDAVFGDEAHSPGEE